MSKKQRAADFILINKCTSKWLDLKCNIASRYIIGVKLFCLSPNYSFYLSLQWWYNPGRALRSSAGDLLVNLWFISVDDAWLWNPNGLYQCVAMQITEMPWIQHYEIPVLKLWLTGKFGLLGSMTYTFAIQSKNTVIITVLCWRGYGISSICHTSVYQKPVTSWHFGCDMLPEPWYPSVSSWASRATLRSLWPTTKHHSLWPHLSESLPVTCVLLPIMSGKVINKGFDLNWLLWNWKCPQVC